MRTKRAVFEVKTVHVCPSRYRRTGQRAVDTRAKQVPKDYFRRAHGLDKKYAPSDTRADFSSPGPKGPFERSFDSLATGGPTPAVVGAFGELNKKFDGVVRMRTGQGADAVFLH